MLITERIRMSPHLIPLQVVQLLVADSGLVTSIVLSELQRHTQHAWEWDHSLPNSPMHWVKRL